MPFASWAKIVAEFGAFVTEIAGVIVILLSTLYALGRSLWEARTGMKGVTLFQTLRRRTTRGMLLGLEFLVAGDIIRTVAIELTLLSVTTLGVVVLIRAFLSFTLEVELDGRWPWQKTP